MNEYDLDEILKEVKERNQGGDAPAEETIEETPAEAVAETEATAQETVEEAPAEETAEEVPVEEAPAEEAAEEPAEQSPVEEEPTEGAIDILSVANDPDENEEDYVELIPVNEEPPKKKKGLGIIIAVLAVVLAAALGVGAYLYFTGAFNKTPEAETTTEPTTQAIKIDSGTPNPINGEMGFNINALGKRPVAVVVENEYSTAAVRPQWGIADADMIMEGETEFSTRLLFFWADMNMVPEQVGPSRSARPPFIRFSQLWDSIFIHTGLSRSKDDYEGADTVFENENIDHINLLAQAEDGKYFGRDNSRQTAVEHTGYLNGKNVVQLIANNKIGTDLREARFTKFEFNDEDAPVGDDDGEKATFKWSDRCPKTGVFTYDSAKGVYTTEDFDSKYGKSNLEVKNLIYLLDDTEYIVKENYKHAGASETYCNYDLAGGTGKVFSNGTSTDIKWEKENGKLVIKNLDGETVKLNRGKIYIGYGSSNHGGSITAE